MRLTARRAGRASANTSDVQRAIPLLVTIALGFAPATAAAAVTRVSVGTGGEQATAESGGTSNGRTDVFAAGPLR